MNSSVLTLLESKINELTAAQKKVGDYILKYPSEAAFMTVEQISGKIDVSVATVMRLCYGLGFSGFSQFQKELQGLLINRVAPPSRLETNIKKQRGSNLILKCAELQINNIKKTVDFLSEEKVAQAFDLILKAKKIYIVGDRTSGSAAAYLNEGLNRLGLDCEWFNHDSSRVQSSIAKMTPDVLVIVICLPRYSKKAVSIAKAASEKCAKILAITDGYSSPVSNFSDVFLSCAFDSLSFHHSAIGAIFVADVLVTGVANKNAADTKRFLEEIELVSVAIDANVVK